MPAAAPRTRPRSRWRRLLAWSAVALMIVGGGTVGLMLNTWPPPDQPTAENATADQRAVGFVEEQLRAQGTPDAAFAAIRDGEPTAAGTLGDGVTTESPFLLGSLSKPFTGLAVMQLVDAGRVELDDPVTEYIPWFTTGDGDHGITLRHLLTQTSGLPTWAGQVDLTEPETTLKERVRAVAEVNPVRPPGEAYEYCNKNFAVLGLVVEAVTGTSYAEYLRRHVFEPLGMQHTFTDLDRAERGGLVEGSSVWFGAHVPQAPREYPGALPDGYIISTVNDLAALVQAQSTGAYQGRQILSQASLREMYRTPAGVPEDPHYRSEYGLGWRVSEVGGRPLVFHEGELMTYTADLAVLPEERRGLVILTAHHPMLVDIGVARSGGARILAGEPTPAIDQGYRTTYFVVLVAGAIVLVLLLASAVGLVPRVCDLPRRIATQGRRRAVLVPAAAHLLAAVALYTTVFYGLGQALGQPGFLRLSMSYAFVPDVTTIVLAAVGYLMAAAGVIGLVGLRRACDGGLSTGRAAGERSDDRISGAGETSGHGQGERPA